MAYTTPRTYVAGEVHTAAHHNTYERDNISWLATDSPACRVYKTVVQSITSTSNITLLFDAERYDNAAMHSTSVNTSRITVPSGGGGKYLIGSTIAWALNGTGFRQCRFFANGTTNLAIDSRPTDSAAASGVECAPSTNYALVATDYVECLVQQTSGGALNVSGNPGTGPEFFAFWFRT